jgi:signal peptidase I
VISAVDARDLAASTDVRDSTGRVAQYGRLLLITTLVTIIAGLGLLVVARPFGIGTVLTHGSSMGDAVPNGSLAVTRTTSKADVRTGDIIVIDTAATKIHRVIAIADRDGERVVQTQGDATGGPDPGFYALGSDTPRVVAVVPVLGFVVAFTMSPLGWLILTAAPLAWLLASFLWRVWARGDAQER